MEQTLRLVYQIIFLAIRELTLYSSIYRNHNLGVEMLKKIALSGVITVFLAATSVSAADVIKKFSIEEATLTGTYQNVITGEIAMYWGDQPHPEIIKKFGSYKVSKRTNGFMKEPEDSCTRAMASALVVLQNRAIKKGGNAVVNIQSNIQNNEESSSIEFTCLVGSVMVNSALKGTVVTLK